MSEIIENDAPVAALYGIAGKQPDQAAFQRAEKLLTSARNYTIDSPTMYELVSEDLMKVKALAKSIEEQRVSITGPINQGLKAINGLFKGPLEYCAQAESILKNALLTYDREQERKRQEAQRAAEEEARKERERLAAEAAAAEAAARAEAERLEQEAKAAADAGDTERAAQLEAEAQETVAAGQEQAQELALNSQLITAAPVAPATPKVSGISTRKNWKARVDDKLVLVQYIAANPQYLDLLDVDQSALNAMAKALKDKLALPGCTAYSDDVMSARAA